MQEEIERRTAETAALQNEYESKIKTMNNNHSSERFRMRDTMEELVSNHGKEFTALQEKHTQEMEERKKQVTGCVLE